MDAANPLVARVAPCCAARRKIALIGLALTLGYLVVLAGTYLTGNFFADAQGRPIANDFVNVWAAGRLALDGNPAAAYDWAAHKAAETRAVDHDFPGYYGWHYPPSFLFVAAALALLPYLVAAGLWLLATLAAYVAAIAAILGGRAGMFLALGFPAALWNVAAGQNGFLTAALIGGTLSLLERRPALAGVCLGLLSYKPQFGLLFPVALIAGGHWRTITTAAMVTGGLAAASWFAFGGAAWAAFVHWLPITGHVVLGKGDADFARLQSFYGLARAAGGEGTLAWTVQGAASLTAAAGVARIWLSRLPYDLKAATLAAAALIVTPYLYMYDLVAAAVAVAFLLRFALPRGLTRAEIVGLTGAGALILAFPELTGQVGLAAVLIVVALIGRRITQATAHDCDQNRVHADRDYGFPPARK